MTIAFIPCRKGSQGIPGKNKKNINGKPLFHWTVQAASRSRSITQVVLATDDEEIIEDTEKHGWPKVQVYRRLEENARNESSTSDVILEYLTRNEKNLDGEEIFILIQATSPMLRSEEIDAAFQCFLQSGKDSLVSVSGIKRFLWGRDGKPLNYDFRHRPRRQEFKEDDILWIENGAIYISRIKSVMEHKNVLSGNIIPLRL